MDEKFYTIAEVSASLKVNEITIRRYIKSGLLKSRRLSKQYRITETDLNEFLRREEKAETMA